MVCYHDGVLCQNTETTYSGDTQTSYSYSYTYGNNSQCIQIVDTNSVTNIPYFTASNIPANQTASVTIKYMLHVSWAAYAGDNHSGPILSSGSQDYTVSSTTLTWSGPTSLGTLSVSVSSIGTTSCRVSWNYISGASSYSVTCGSFSTTTTSTACNITGLLPGTSYTVLVKAIASGSDHVDSGYGTASFVTIKNPLPTPVLSLVGTLSSDSLIVTFDKVSDATQYVIEYSTSDTFTNKQTITVS